MSTLSPTRKVSRKHELREDKVVTFYARMLDFFENNKSLVYGSLIGIAAILVAIFGYSYVQSNRNDEALDLMMEAVSRYENGDFVAAVDGDISFTGLRDIAEDFGSTKAGNLARFYAADALYRTGQLDESLKLFQDYEKGSDFLGASAYAGEAAIHETKGEHAVAADLYKRAADVFVSDVTSPDYLQKAAREYEMAGDLDAARRVYLQLQDDFPSSSPAQNVEFFLAQMGRAG